MNEDDLSRVVGQPLTGSAELPQRPTEDVPPTAPDTADKPWWCATCESWRYTQPCGRDEYPQPES